MVSTHPTLSLKYFCLRKNNIPKGIKELFYLSWEDALWDILGYKRIKKGSVILLPNFYCSDVENNIKKHGYNIARYNISRNLMADKKSFANSIKKYKPKVIVIFHPVGIKSNLLANLNWLVNVIGDSVLIEDAVHRIIDIRDFEIIKKNHFVIDSLRKVIPLQGSRIIGKKEDINFNAPSFFQSFFYSAKVNMNCFLMNLYWTLGLYKKAEKLMLKGYDLIGDSIFPAKGSVIAKLFADRINVAKIQRLKEKQVDCYEKILKNILPIKLRIDKNDKSNLRGYPVILPINIADTVLKYLRKHNFFVRFELDGCGWSEKQKIIYLPLGFHINKNIQDKICFLVNNAMRKV